MYGFNLNFTSFGEGKYKTLLGGFLTILTLDFVLALLVIFEKPFFQSLNPNVIYQTLNLSYYPMMTPDTSKFPVAFRFENQRKEPANIGATLSLPPADSDEKKPGWIHDSYRAETTQLLDLFF